MISLTQDQLQYCARAVEALKAKLKTSDVITQEFESLEAKRLSQLELERVCSVAMENVNVNKNRYLDVLPYDTTRVVLNSPSDSTRLQPTRGGDYINANFVQVSADENAVGFIATQGPLPHTYEDFWEMVFQNRCPAIVMLTRLIDNDQVVKCDDYFQTTEIGHREFGNMCIVTESIETTKESGLILRRLQVTKAKSEEPPLSVLHIQYPDWPDHGVPTSTSPTREILRMTNQLSSNVGPTHNIVVHCSAGIGRTGTYCIVHHSVQRIINGDMSALDLEKSVSFLRSKRARMVQTSDQYFFCYGAIVDELEALISDSSTAKSL